MLFTLQTKYTIGGDNLYVVLTGDKRLYLPRRAVHSHPVTWGGREGVGVDHSHITGRRGHPC